MIWFYCLRRNDIYNQYRNSLVISLVKIIKAAVTSQCLNRSWLFNEMPTKLETRNECIAADFNDELKEFRDKYIIPSGLIYCNGNSLGVCPKNAVDVAARVIKEDWAANLTESYLGWYDLPKRVGDKLSKLIGGEIGESIPSESTSTNLFKCLGTSIAIQKIDRPNRRVIIVEENVFPTDIYVVEGLVRLLSSDGYSIRFFNDTNPLETVIADDTVAVITSHVNAFNGKVFDLKTTTDLVHSKGAHIIFDLSHSVGAMKINLNEANADFAVSCTYKYLNGGPGAPAFSWVNKKHHNRVWTPLTGWLGHEEPLAMKTQYAPSKGINRFLTGQQHIIQLAVLENSLDIILKADMDMIRKKSLEMTDLFIDIVEKNCPSLVLVTPRNHNERGSHVSFRHENASEIREYLRKSNILCDLRHSVILRFAVTPLFLRYVDIWDAAQMLCEAVRCAKLEKSKL